METLPDFGQRSQQGAPVVVATRLRDVPVLAHPRGTHTAVIRSSWKVTKAISSRLSVTRLRSALNSSVSFSSSSP